MAAVSAAAGWTAEDDVLLKNAVEDRWYSLLYELETSLQASARMAKYEAELSTSNPAKANKLFNSKAKVFSLCKRKIDSVKNQYYAMRKRVCHEPCLSADFGYVIAPCSCSPIDGGDCACGGLLKRLEGRLLVHKVDPSGAVVNGYGCIGGSCSEEQHVHSNGNGQYSFHTEHASPDGSIVIDGNSNHESLHDYSDEDQLYGYDYMQKNLQIRERNIVSTDNRSDLSDQYDNGATGSKSLPSIAQDDVKLGQFSGDSTGGLLEPGSFKAISQKWCSQAPSIPTWSKVQGVNSSDILTDMSRTERKTLMLSDDKKMETNNSDALAFQSNLDGVISDSGLRNEMVPEGGFMHPNLKGFSQKEDLELVSSEHFSDSALDTNQEDLGGSQAKVFLKGSSRGPHLSPSDATNCDNRIDPIQKKHNVADVSGINTILALSEVLYPVHDVECMLNTEDSEIPLNDHILIPGESSLEPMCTFDQDSQHDTYLVPTTLINMENVQPLPPPPPITLEPAILEKKENIVSLNEGCIVGSEPGLHGDFCGNNANMHTLALHSIDVGEETTCGFVQHECCDNLQNLTLDKSIQVPDQMHCKFLAGKVQIGCETAIQNWALSHALPDTEFHNPIETISISGQAEGSDSENSVPNYFDLEALILDQDLIPWDQESDFIQPEVSRFQYPESRKDLIRLEKGACSYMNRSIMSKGAFAVLYGQHLKYYIRDPEVTLGRETGEVHVNIDLGKEGKANKISRRQAVIKMDDSGSFYIKNTGKCSIFVNSKEVPCNKRINLISDSLLEIRNMKFIFHVNHDAVKKHIARIRKGSSQGENTAFVWNQNP
ncbi:uncharacterized protein LOC133890590 isoform X2 [Phragmites australis]|uniref:uncharacterized protein LOC133890590 isoform X2 n=1 Tax=Phragmites australis TaxID=29695 RepID=UPI002D788612|nr:uncharacterized protein LOC133890590 isoform X2 [Phragmites australis]